MTARMVTETDAEWSAECALAAQRSEYRDLHAICRRTEGIPLPHASGILLQRRCGCTCHRNNRPGSTA